jgi:hypothetical protein
MRLFSPPRAHLQQNEQRIKPHLLCRPKSAGKSFQMSVQISGLGCFRPVPAMYLYQLNSEAAILTSHFLPSSSIV